MLERASGIVFNQAYTQRQLRTSFFRKAIRSRIYLNQALKYIVGPTIDFGCGTGQLLARLPKGSIGLEINEATVSYCRAIGLDVRRYDPAADNYTFYTLNLDHCKYKTFLMSHVLEHVEHPTKVFRRIIRSCDNLNIERIVLIVPGLKGFRSDPTHVTFINAAYLREHSLYAIPPYRVTKKRYFPFPFARVGNYFTHNEFQVVYDRG